MGAKLAVAWIVTLAAMLQVGGQPAWGADAWPDLERESAALVPDLELLYEDIHRNPELSGAERRTSSRLASELRTLGFSVDDRFGGEGVFGVVGVLENGPGPTVMMRTETDALPVVEQTGASYASTVRITDPSGDEVGVMHACGHDIHMVSVIGAARLLAAHRESWSGTLMVVAQPDEERGRGAKALLEAGLFEKFPRPDFLLALHVDAQLAVGKLGYTEGFIRANVNSVDIVVNGKGGHGAYPEYANDPVPAAAAIISALQTIVSREVSPLDSAVVTVGTVHGGTKRNVIPGSVKLELTVRTYSDATRVAVLDSIERVATSTARSYGLPEPQVVVLERYTPAAYNTPELVRRLVARFDTVFGPGNVVSRNPTMGGDDFGRYGREEPRIPSVMLRLGSVDEQLLKDPDSLPSLHSPTFLPDKAAIENGVIAMSAALLELLGRPDAR